MTVEADSNFDWPVCNEAEDQLRSLLAGFLAENAAARRLAQRMRDETATDFLEWVDHLVLDAAHAEWLESAGFVPEAVEIPGGASAWEHPRALLPRVLMLPRAPRSEVPVVVALRPEYLADFLARQGSLAEPEGKPLARYRRALLAEENATRLEAVERRGYRGYQVGAQPPEHCENVLKARELWRRRKRDFGDDAEGIRHAFAVLERVLTLVDRDTACHLFFEEERAYWESRNRAARFQKLRQDSLGLGWGNHDHHTFRCSRPHFVDLISFLERLGFERRERYYAGAQAGWGAQILEQKNAGIVVFADVDLAPDETAIDFSRERLSPRASLGTVGLWTALHGESLLQAGMHHLEARFDFALLREQMQEAGIATMKPFSDFAFLRQAFTEGERWRVDRKRVEALRARDLISPSQADSFLSEGAIGSHLENLQRRGGFKGFNQTSVSAIIAATDPRTVREPGSTPAGKTAP